MYYYTGRSGDRFTDATIHADRACCPEPSRPIAESSLRSDADFCPDCTGASSDTCEVEKSDGEICGRERPCRYHD
jgi:hypothetical protein